MRGLDLSADMPGMPTGSLVPYLPDATLDSGSETIFKELRSGALQADASRILVQALGTIG